MSLDTREKIKFVSLAVNDFAMSTAELKLDIIEKVKTLTSKSKLNSIAEILHDEDVYILSEAQRQRIAQAREEIARGEEFTSEEVFKELEEWLNEE
ncbi:MAG TPA: hypothetical protein VGB95_02000 [Chitinophagales bacterium]